MEAPNILYGRARYGTQGSDASNGGLSISSALKYSDNSFRRVDFDGVAVFENLRGDFGADDAWRTELAADDCRMRCDTALLGDDRRRFFHRGHDVRIRRDRDEYVALIHFSHVFGADNNLDCPGRFAGLRHLSFEFGD